MSEDKKFQEIMKLLEDVKSKDDLDTILKNNKLSDYDQLQKVEGNVLEKQIRDRFNISSNNPLTKSAEIQEITNEIINKDYPHLNSLRNIVGEPNLPAGYGFINGAGQYLNIAKKAGVDNGIFLNANGSSIGKLSTLAHEIGHGNDDISKLIASILIDGNNKNSEEVRKMLLLSNDVNIQNFLKDLEKHPDMHKQYVTSQGLGYDTPKLQKHLEILKNNPDMVNNNNDLKKMQTYLEQNLAKGNDTKNLDPLFRKNHKLSDYIDNYDQYHIPTESMGRAQASSDYDYNKKVSDLVPDNSVLTSNADRHHLPRIDEVDNKGLLDKGNWESRNIKRLFNGKGLKSLAALAGPLVKGTSIGAATLAAMSAGNKAMAGDFEGAASDTGELAYNLVEPSIVTAVAPTTMGNSELPPEEMLNRARFNLINSKLKK